MNTQNALEIAISELSSIKTKELSKEDTDELESIIWMLIDLEEKLEAENED
jgi:hypothetical protein